MKIEEFISKSYPKISSFSGVDTIENVLLENEYAVVVDENNKYLGILTPSDLVKNPHKIVIDCLTEKEHILYNDDGSSVANKFKKSCCSVLPVFNETTFLGVIKRKDVFDKLEVTVNELYDKSLVSEKLKNNFLLNLAHEVRTPLNGIIGFLDILSESDKKDGDAFRDIIKASTDKFLFIMRDLVDLSLLHSNCNLEVKKEKIDVKNIFFSLKEYFDKTLLVVNKNISIKYLMTDSSHFLFSDEKKIKHILYHLIDNAVKFSNNSCAVNFGSKIEGHNVVFYVENEGLSIPEEKREKIFEVFEKQDKFKNDLVDGFGIGLTLVKRLTGLLGGKVSFLSNEKLTTFFCSIPLK